MTEKSKNLIQEEMLNLPKEHQNAIDFSNWEKISGEIGKKYLLDEDETETLQLETASVLFGLVDENDYTQNIENSVGTSKNEAEKIAEEVNQKIFMPIYYSLTEKLKENIKTKNPDWEQNLNFVLSGGDYSVFMKRRDDTINTTPYTPLVRGNTMPSRPDKGEAGRGF